MFGGSKVSSIPGWFGLVGGLLWLTLWAQNALGPGVLLSQASFQMSLSIPILLCFVCLAGLRDRMGDLAGIELSGMRLVFVGLAMMLFGFLFRYALGQLPQARAGQPVPFQGWPTALIALGIIFQPFGLLFLSANSRPGFSPLIRGVLLAMGVGLLVSLMIGLTLALSRVQSQVAVSAMVFIFGGGWTLLGLLSIFRPADR